METTTATLQQLIAHYRHPGAALTLAQLDRYVNRGNIGERAKFYLDTAEARTVITLDYTTTPAGGAFKKGRSVSAQISRYNGYNLKKQAYQDAERERFAELTPDRALLRDIRATLADMRITQDMGIVKFYCARLA